MVWFFLITNYVHMCMITSSSHEQTEVEIETNGLRSLKLERKGPLKFRHHASKEVRIAYTYNSMSTLKK